MRPNRFNEYTWTSSKGHCMDNHNRVRCMTDNIPKDNRWRTLQQNEFWNITKVISTPSICEVLDPCQLILWYETKTGS